MHLSFYHRHTEALPVISSSLLSVSAVTVIDTLPFPMCTDLLRSWVISAQQTPDMSVLISPKSIVTLHPSAPD